MCCAALPPCGSFWCCTHSGFSLQALALCVCVCPWKKHLQRHLLVRKWCETSLQGCRSSSLFPFMKWQIDDLQIEIWEPHARSAEKTQKNTSEISQTVSHSGLIQSAELSVPDYRLSACSSWVRQHFNARFDLLCGPRGWSSTPITK